MSEIDNKYVSQKAKRNKSNSHIWEEQAKSAWPEVINIVKKTNYIYFSINLNQSVFVRYHAGVAIIDAKILPFILDFLREKSIQITWVITGQTFDVKYFNVNNEMPKMLLNYIRNGDNLRVELFADFNRTAENILETFKGIRFSEIRIDMSRDDECLQFIWNTMHTEIYYSENMRWVLFEPTNSNEF